MNTCLSTVSILAIFSLLTTCSFAQVISSSGKSFEVNQKNEAKIQILQFKITEADGSDKIELLKSTVAIGNLKRELQINTHQSHESEKITCSLITEDQISHEYMMSHPLQETYEYVDEETNQLKKKTVHHTEKIFLVRVPYRKESRQLQFSKKDRLKKRVVISTFPLN